MPKQVSDYLDSLMVDMPVNDSLDTLLDPTGVNPDNILRVGDVEGKDLQYFLDRLASENALYFYGKAYKLFKRILSDINGYKAEMIKEDDVAWLESRWVSTENPDLHVDFRVPLYENTKGNVTKGKRVTLDGWTD